ncbi:MAG: threo-3-hydroxy-L-aspartate ammonia-lyase [Candidatus Eremiobacteraeota bacterium]|nr:threo-3-hydroxy-L-aspartate ammonia-lyase [Candidatus Eremiobacteraeota bacterium]
MNAARDLVSFADVRAAAARLKGVVHRTPVMTSRTLDEQTGAHAFLKCENFQRMGAFKFRGAYNRLVQLSAPERRRGVVAFSSGNHAQGVALAAKLLDIPATIVMPADAPQAKLDATRGYGAQVVLYDRAEEDRDRVARGIAAERGAILVPPYDDVHIIAGQGTASLELLEEAGGLDILLVPTGGAGLFSGSAVAAHGVDPAIAVYGVEPENGNDVQQSMQTGQRVHIPVPNTIADGQMTQSPGEITFALIQQYGRGVVTVSEEEIKDAMRFAFARMKLVIEPSGATALAALMFDKLEHRGKRVGVIISGGNVDPKRFADIIA